MRSLDFFFPNTLTEKHCQWEQKKNEKNSEERIPENKERENEHLIEPFSFDAILLNWFCNFVVNLIISWTTYCQAFKYASSHVYVHVWDVPSFLIFCIFVWT